MRLTRNPMMRSFWHMAYAAKRPPACEPGRCRWCYRGRMTASRFSWGDRKRYTREFETCPGTYWYVQDFIERGDDDDLVLSIGAQTAGDSDQVYADYVAKYGKDNADYLMDAMVAWQAHYERAVYIDLGLGDGRAAAERAQSDAEHRGWRYEQMAGDLVLVRRLLAGDWDADFLVLQPGDVVEMAGGEAIVSARHA